MSTILKLLAALLIVVMLCVGFLWLKPPEPTPVPTATVTVTVTAASIPTVRPTPTLTPTTPPTATAFPTPDSEQGWVEVYADQVWIRQTTPIENDELPCPYTWSLGRGCGGKTLEVVTNLEGYYLNVWVRDLDGSLTAVQAISLTPGKVIQVVVPENGIVGFGNAPAK